jgi:hypothetical protein
MGMKEQFGKALTVMLALVMSAGLVGAADVTASYTSSYAPAGCSLSVYEGTAITLPGTLNVMNSGSPGVGGDGSVLQSTMSVNVAFNDGGDYSTALGGWYNGVGPDPSGGWVSGISTTWTATGTGGANGPWPLQGITATPVQSAAYTGLVSGGSSWSPITFGVNADKTLPAGTYHQTIVLTGSC